MATPAFLRYLPARLKPLSSPAVWAPLTIFTLVSIFMWEWSRNPDWFNRPQAESVTPESTLTPEEEAQLSEIDTIEVLLENARLSAGSSTDTPALADFSDSASTQPAGTTPDAKLGRELANRENPFAIYEEEYKFSSGTNANSSQILAPSTSLSTGSEASAPATSALSNALLRQARQEEEQPTNSLTTAERSGSVSSFSTDPSAGDSPRDSGRSSRPSTNPEGFSTAPPAGSVSAPFIRTTTDMSPPIGTTGYQTPASTNLPVFNVPPPQPSRNPYSSSPPLSSPGTSQNFGQTTFTQPVSPAPSLPEAAAPAGSYTPPSFSQPAQNRRVR